jgi:hypothetical protein
MGRKKRLPQMAGGSASALTLSRPAQASLALWPAGSLSHPKVTFVTRLRPDQLPGRAARQLPDLSTIIRVEPSSTDDSRRQGALPIAVVSSRSNIRSQIQFPRSPPTPNRRKVETVTCSICAK